MIKLLAIVAMCALAQTVAAASVASPCLQPDYAQLKNADARELREEYCSATRRALSEDRLHTIVEDTVAKKRTLAIDASQAEKESLDLIDSRTSCLVRAAKFKSALYKRFQSKPPKSCD